MARPFQVPSVTATTSPVRLSVICAMNPPSPICWREVPMYSRPLSSSLKSLVTIATVSG